MVYRNLKYPGILREKRIEAKVDILLINHSEDDYEVIIKNESGFLFEQTIKSSIEKTREIWLKKNEKIFVEFCICFKLIENNNTISELDCDCPIIEEQFAPIIKY